MSGRRSILAAFAAAPMLSTLPGMALAQAAPPSAAAAKQFIQQTGQQLVAVVNGGGSQAQKGDALVALVNQVVAVDVVGDYVLGRYRQVATAAQYQQFQSLFHQLLAYNITYQIRAYQGVTFTVNSAAVQGNDLVVDTTVTRPGQNPADVGWAVDTVNGAPKIVDVIVAGTSLRITTRNDYSSVVINNGGQVSALLDAMQRQLAKLKADQG